MVKNRSQTTNAKKKIKKKRQNYKQSFAGKRQADRRRIIPRKREQDFIESKILLIRIQKEKQELSRAKALSKKNAGLKEEREPKYFLSGCKQILESPPPGALPSAERIWCLSIKLYEPKDRG